MYLKIIFNLKNSAEPDEKQHFEALHLGLHCLSKYSFRSQWFNTHVQVSILAQGEGAQWFSGRVLGSRPSGLGFEPHRLHCVVSLMPRSHIHGFPRRFYYGLNLTDDPGNANFRSPIRMHYICIIKYYYV